MRYLRKKLLVALIMFAVATIYASGNSDVIVRFGILTDVHYGKFSKGRRPNNYASLEKMRECIKTMNKERVACVVEIGDFIGNGHPSSRDAFLWLRTIENEYGKFMGPRYHVFGNHDPVPLDKMTFMRNVTNTGIPKYKTYYSFVIKGIQFIVLDSAFRKDGTPYGDGRDFDWKDTIVPEKELKWLKKTLESHNGKSVVFLHHLAHNDKAKSNVKNGPQLRKIFNESGKVIAVFSGHLHKGTYVKRDGIHYYVLKSMVEKPGIENTSYAIVEINSDYSLRIVGYGRTENQILK